MGKLIVDLSVSLDGYVAGPDQTMQDPLGRGGEQLHDWAFAAAGLARGDGSTAATPTPYSGDQREPGPRRRDDHGPGHVQRRRRPVAG